MNSGIARLVGLGNSACVRVTAQTRPQVLQLFCLLFLSNSESSVSHCRTQSRPTHEEPSRHIYNHSSGTTRELLQTYSTYVKRSIPDSCEILLVKFCRRLSREAPGRWRKAYTRMGTYQSCSSSLLLARAGQARQVDPRDPILLPPIRNEKRVVGQRPVV